MFFSGAVAPVPCLVCGSAIENATFPSALTLGRAAGAAFFTTPEDKNNRVVRNLRAVPRSCIESKVDAAETGVRAMAAAMQASRAGRRGFMC